MCRHTGVITEHAFLEWKIRLNIQMEYPWKGVSLHQRIV